MVLKRLSNKAVYPPYTTSLRICTGDKLKGFQVPVFYCPEKYIQISNRESSGKKINIDFTVLRILFGIFFMDGNVIVWGVMKQLLRAWLTSDFT